VLLAPTPSGNASLGRLLARCRHRSSADPGKPRINLAAGAPTLQPRGRLRCLSGFGSGRAGASDAEQGQGLWSVVGSDERYREDGVAITGNSHHALTPINPTRRVQSIPRLAAPSVCSCRDAAGPCGLELGPVAAAEGDGAACPEIEHERAGANHPGTHTAQPLDAVSKIEASGQ